MLLRDTPLEEDRDFVAYEEDAQVILQMVQQIDNADSVDVSYLQQLIEQHIDLLNEVGNEVIQIIPTLPPESSEAPSPESLIIEDEEDESEFEEDSLESSEPFI